MKSPFKLTYILAGFLVLFSLGGCSLSLTQPAETEDQANTVDDELLQPNPSLTPEDVIRIQVEALQNNDGNDTGIEITFRFASPENKQYTGPLNRFKRMVKSPAYSPMLNHKLAEYGPLEISEETATQRVTIVDSNGKATVYLFSLSKQSGSACEGCWMTDSVVVVPVRQQRLDGA